MKTTPSQRPSKWIFLSIIMSLTIPSISLAMSSSTTENKSTLEKTGVAEEQLQRHFWYDGDQKRSVWINPKLKAEFNDPSKTTKTINTPRPFVRFLNIEADNTSIKSAENILGKDKNSRLSPVLHSVASTSATKKALPGNVIVQMKPEWTPEQIQTWFKTQNVTAINPLTFAPNAFLIQSRTGLESLNLANRLYETGDVVLASPNWWQERVTR